MTVLGRYILSVGIAALLVGILTRFLDSKSSVGAICKMVCSIFLTFVVLKPVGKLDFDRLDSYIQSYESMGEAAAVNGEVIANDAYREIIKQKTEAYILDKAGLYECQLKVLVTVGEGDIPVPEAVKIQGDVSPYARMKLQQLIAEELGIPKEKQQWIG